MEQKMKLMKPFDITIIVSFAHLKLHASRHSKKKDDKGTTPDVGKPTRAKGQKENLKNGMDVDDLQLQDFIQVMQPQVNSKMRANYMSGLTIVGNNRAVSNKDNEGASVPIDDSDSLEDGFLDIFEPSGKSLEPERDKVISNMDYFKSRMMKEWFDSESSDKDDDDNDDNDTSLMTKMIIMVLMKMEKEVIQEIML
ncbi:hypothetical protein LR48_Vigan08g080100 [Vigna angularis]|uniref:Uncharacterized protein n=1 Tax=Phaseolus angularis TaxID=3914 RepID=A0A0L9V5N9_PHAAN|nr:hypothetical protein LR48_Vigan08g080100 [Vigna angularis]